LGDDDIGTSIDRAAGLRSAAHRVHHEGTGGVGDRDEWRRVAPEERDEPSSAIEAAPEPLLLFGPQDQVDPERLVGERGHAPEGRVDLLRLLPGHRQHPERTRFAGG
jgi:hypothetical protein